MKIFSLVLFVIFLSISVNAQGNDELTGRKGPNFKLETLSGKYTELNNYLGKGPVLLSFWATWCKPCLEEMTHLQKIYDKYKDQGFTMLAVSTDSEKSVAKVKPYIKSKGYTFPVLLDTNSEVARDYYVRNVPYTILLNSEGEVVYSHSGYKKGDEIKLAELIDKMVN